MVGGSDNIPSTPGLVPWAFNSLKTIVTGTPAIKRRQMPEDDEIFAELNQSINDIASSIKKTDLTRRNLFASVEPSTPLASSARTAKETVAGILKTPGTIGPQKNVSFAPKFDNPPILEESPTARKSLPKDSIMDNKTNRIRSGLPRNFPGKFPSPMTPKVIKDAIIEETLDENAKANTKKNAQLGSKISKKFESKTYNIENPNAEFSSDVDAIPIKDLQDILNYILETNNQLESIVKDGKLKYELSRVMKEQINNINNKRYEKVLLELKQQVMYAVEYAKLKDEETLRYKAQLAGIEKNSAKSISFNDTNKYEQHEHSMLAELNSQTEHLERTLELREKIISQKNEDIEELKNRIESLQQQLQPKNEESNRGSQAHIIGQLEEQLTEIQRDHRYLSRQNNDLDSENSRLKSKISELEVDVSSLRQSSQQKLDAEKNFADTERELQRRISALEASNRQMERQLAQRSSEAIAYQEFQNQQQPALEAEKKLARSREMNKAQEAKIARLEATAADLNNHVTLLREQLTKKQEELASQPSSTASSRTESMLRNDILVLKQKNRELESEYSSMRLELRKEKAKIGGLTGNSEEVDKLRTEVQELKQSNERLKRKALFNTEYAKNNPILTGLASNRPTFSANSSPNSIGSNASSVPATKETRNFSGEENLISFSSPLGIAKHPIQEAYSIRDVTMRDVTMKDASVASISRSIVLPDPERQRAAEERIAARRATRSNSSRYSASSMSSIFSS